MSIETAEEFVARLLSERLEQCPRSSQQYLINKPFHDAVNLVREVLITVVDQCRQAGFYTLDIERVIRGTVAELIDDQRIDQRELARWLAQIHGPGTV